MKESLSQECGMQTRSFWKECLAAWLLGFRSSADVEPGTSGFASLAMQAGTDRIYR